MLRIVVFLATVLTGVAFAGGLDWWMDPFNDRYSPDAVTAALAARPQPCLISQQLVGQGATGDFKWDLVRRKQPRTLVVGSSRVGRLAAHPGENTFVNLSVAGFDPIAIPSIFSHLASIDHAPITIYLGAEAFWFNPSLHGTYIPWGRDWRGSLKLWLSPQTLWATIHILRRAPGSIRHPRALRAWNRVDGPHGCVIDVGNSVYGGAAQAWGPDGTLYLQTELSSSPSNRPRFVDENIDYYTGTKWSASVQGDIVRALAFAHAHGWRVVGFSPPYASDSYDLLAHDPRYATLWSMFVHRAPQIFGRYGYPFLDLSDSRTLSACTDDTFIFRDGAHPGEACEVQVRRILDARAAKLPPPG